MNEYLTAVAKENEDDAQTMMMVESLRLVKGSIVIALLSLIEGRTDRIIHDRLVTELNFDTLKDILLDVHKYFIVTYQVPPTHIYISPVNQIHE